MLIYEMEVDVAIRRPPIPANVRTTFVRLAVPNQPSLTRADNEARLVGAWMGHRHGEIVTAVRITSVEL